jgi:hypothetical protein
VLINLGRRAEAIEWLEHWRKNPQTYDIQPFLDRARALQGTQESGR